MFRRRFLKPAVPFSLVLIALGVFAWFSPQQVLTVDSGPVKADTLVGPSVKVGLHAVLTAGSVATKSLEPGGIYRGNPAVLLKQRVISAKV